MGEESAMGEQRAMGEHSPDDVIRRYLSAMEACDLDGVLACFAGDGIISSPVYGEVPVRPFYERLFADTLSVQVAIHHVYRATDDAARWAAHFAYDWERRDAPAVSTDLIDLFEFDAASLITRLRIIFDSGARPA
jgi:ketosteroid isomerase-like protein